MGFISVPRDFWGMTKTAPENTLLKLTVNNRLIVMTREKEEYLPLNRVILDNISSAKRYTEAKGFVLKNEVLSPLLVKCSQKNRYRVAQSDVDKFKAMIMEFNDEKVGIPEKNNRVRLSYLTAEHKGEVDMKKLRSYVSSDDVAKPLLISVQGGFCVKNGDVSVVRGVIEKYAVECRMQVPPDGCTKNSKEKKVKITAKSACSVSGNGFVNVSDIITEYASCAPGSEKFFAIKMQLADDLEAEPFLHEKRKGYMKVAVGDVERVGQIISSYKIDEFDLGDNRKITNVPRAGGIRIKDETYVPLNLIINNIKMSRADLLSFSNEEIAADLLNLGAISLFAIEEDEVYKIPSSKVEYVEEIFNHYNPKNLKNVDFSSPVTL